MTEVATPGVLTAPTAVLESQETAHMDPIHVLIKAETDRRLFKSLTQGLDVKRRDVGWRSRSRSLNHPCY